MVSISSNQASSAAQRNLNKANAQLSTRVERLSSGKRITKASDDAMSNAIINKINSDIKAMGGALRNTANASALINVVTGALDEVSSMLNRMKELATNVQNGTLSTTEQAYANNEFGKLKSQVDEIASKTRWNGTVLLNGGKSATAAGVVAASATGGLQTVANAFATTFSSTGFLQSATGVSNIVVGGVDTNTSASVDIGGRTFSATGINTTTLAGGSTIVFECTTDSTTSFTLTVAGDASAVATNALFTAEFSDAAGKLWENVTGFVASSAALSNGATSVSTGGDIAAGVYGLRYDGTTSRWHLDDGTTLHTVADTATTGTAHTVTFGNGFKVNVSSAWAKTTDMAQVKYTIANTNTVSLDFQVRETAADTLTLAIDGAGAARLGIDGDDVTNAANAATASANIDLAVVTINDNLAALGARQSELEHIASSLEVTMENLSAALAEYSEMDMAAEMTDFTIQNALVQASVSAISQSNQLPDKLLRLVQ